MDVSKELDNIYSQKLIASTEGEYYSIYCFVKEGEDISKLIYEAEHQFTNFPENNKKYECITFGDYITKEKEKYMKSCSAVTKEKWWEMFEVLPPIFIGNDYKIPGYTVKLAFIVSEPLTSNYYNAYLEYVNKKGEIRYATKIVWRGERSSYWTEQDLDKLEGK